MKQQTLDMHKTCEVVIRWRKMKTQDLRPALFCQRHDHFIDWLKEDMAYQLIDELGVREEPWKYKKPSTRTKQQQPYLLKRKSNRDKAKRIKHK